MTGYVQDADGLDPFTHIAEVVKRSGSSFYLGMRILPAERRRAMYSIDAFCREVDDIADGDDADAVRRAERPTWRPSA